MADIIDETKIEKLVDSETFQIWKFQVTILWKAHGIYDVVSGESKFEKCEKPEEKDAWNRKDARAQKIIVTTIEKKLLMHIINCENSNEMFNKLSSLFQKNTDQEKCNLLQQFFSYKYDKECDISANISKLENMAYRLNNLKQPIDETMVMSKILAILPEKYQHFSTAWESTPLAEKTLNTLTARLLSEESRNKGIECEGAVAFNSSEKKCYTCNNKGHISRFCPKNKSQANKSNVKCFQCNGYGHYAKSCMKNSPKQNYSCSLCNKNNHNEKNCYFRNKKDPKISTSDKVVFLMQENSTPRVDEFVVDSGCSSHMTNNVALMRAMKMQEMDIAVAKKGESLEALGEGIIETENLVLNNVLYAPSLTKNLLSVNAITENGGQVRFTRNAVLITKDDELILEGTKQHNGLYTVDLNTNQKSALISEKKTKAMEWHRKLGHLSIKNMKLLIKLTEGFHIDSKDLDSLDSLCEVCMEAKQTRHPFKTERLRAERPLQIIHTDLCGPIEPKTWDNKSYFLTFLDDYTHYSMVYLLNNKSEVFEHVKEYVHEVEAFMNMKVSKIRCDNGGEYIHGGLRTWCKGRGIVLDYTISHTPQLNGKAERLNRTLMDKARALIFDSKLNKNLWGEAIRTSTYITNRCPTESMDCTPVEKWTKRKPDLSKLKIFGNYAYAKNVGYLKKLDSRSSKFIFIGYGLNGYRLWDPVKQQIIMSRDVVCTERDEEKISEKGLIIRYAEENDNSIHIPQDEPPPIPEEKVTNDPEKRTRKLPHRFNDYVLLTYEAAITGEESEKWKAAIEEEKASLKQNETWEYIDRSKAGDHKILSNRWLFKIKDDEMINLMISRSDAELELFKEMDVERKLEEAKLGNRCHRSRLIEECELPDWLVKEDDELDRCNYEDNDSIRGRGSRQRKEVDYTDSLTEKEWLKAIDDGIDFEEDDEDTERNKSKKKAKKRRGRKEDSDDESVSTAPLKRRKGQTDPKLKKKMRRVMEMVMKHTDPDGRILSEPFMKLPSKRELPDYYEIIKKPLDIKNFLSSTEAEYIAAAKDCTKELIYLKALLEELTLKKVKMKLYIDNQSAIKLIKNGQLNRRSKHIDVRFHFISDIVTEGIIELIYCPTETQTADIFTKPLSAVKFGYHKDTLIYKI